MAQQGFDYTAAQAYFPRGLVQPEGGYRFSADALLLGCFLEPPPSKGGARLLDLGTGSGAVALTMLCRFPSMRVVGVDIQSEYLAAAKANAMRLGFGRAFHALCADILAPDVPLAAGSFDLALANPPYRQRDRGRLPPAPARLLALFEQPDTLAAFCRAAALALRPGGRFGIIFPATRLDELFRRLHDAGLVPRRVLRIHARMGSPPRLLLVEAVKAEQKEGYQPIIDERSLALHPMDKGFSAEALAFCPFLAGRHIG